MQFKLIFIVGGVFKGKVAMKIKEMSMSFLYKLDVYISVILEMIQYFTNCFQINLVTRGRL